MTETICVSSEQEARLIRSRGIKAETRFTEMLRAYREWTGQSIRDLAAEIGIHHSILARIMDGHTFEAGAMSKIVVWLFGDTPSRGERKERLQHNGCDSTTNEKTPS